MKTTMKEHGGSVSLGLGVRVARRYTIAADDHSWPFAAELDAVLEGGELVVDSVVFRRKKGQRGLTSEVIRRLPIGEALYTAFTDPAGGPPSWASSNPTMAADPRTLDEDERVQRAAVVYGLAAVVGDPPVQAVADDLRVSRATAGRLIARAREAGVLAPSIRSRKAG